MLTELLPVILPAKRKGGETLFRATDLKKLYKQFHDSSSKVTKTLFQNQTKQVMVQKQLTYPNVRHHINLLRLR